MERTMPAINPSGRDFSILEKRAVGLDDSMTVKGKKWSAAVGG